MTYEIFESSVPHVDLRNCPTEFDEEVVFCCLTLVNEMANVFVFMHDGDQLLLAVKPHELNGDLLPF